MKIYRGVNTNWITQKFGIENTSPQALPIYQSLGLRGHNGFDFANFPCKPDNYSKEAVCSPVYWDCDIEGDIYKISTDKNIGLGVWVRTKDKDGIFKHRIWHLSRIDCQIGKIGTGDLIGLGGNTGQSTGAHNHRDLTPLTENSNGTYSNTLGDNGYDGCTDLTPYFENIFVLDKIEFQKKQISMLQQIVGFLKVLISLRLSIKK